MRNAVTQLRSFQTRSRQGIVDVASAAEWSREDCRVLLVSKMQATSSGIVYASKATFMVLIVLHLVIIESTMVWHTFGIAGFV